MTEEERQLSLLKGPRQKGEKAPLPSEFEMQCVVADTLRLGLSLGWRYSHFPAGELRTDETGRRLARMGLMKGWPDFVLLNPAGRFHGLELKRGKAPLTVDQQAFQDWCVGHLVPYEVGRSVKEAIGILSGWGAIKVSLADQLSGGPDP
jgi:hypothetical protein